jgi:hypothetical protein
MMPLLPVLDHTPSGSMVIFITKWALYFLMMEPNPHMPNCTSMTLKLLWMLATPETPT